MLEWWLQNQWEMRRNYSSSSLIESNIKLFSVTTTEKTSERYDKEEIRSKIDSDIIEINASNKIALKGVDIGNEKADVTLKGDKGVTISGTQHKTHGKINRKKQACLRSRERFWDIPVHQN